MGPLGVWSGKRRGPATGSCSSTKSSADGRTLRRNTSTRPCRHRLYCSAAHSATRATNAMSTTCYQPVRPHERARCARRSPMSTLTSPQRSCPRFSHTVVRSAVERGAHGTARTHHCDSGDRDGLKQMAGQKRGRAGPPGIAPCEGRRAADTPGADDGPCKMWWSAMGGQHWPGNYAMKSHAPARFINSCRAQY